MGPHTKPIEKEILILTKPIEKEILILTKGGLIPQVGTGHLVRSINIARNIVMLGGARITFLTPTQSELESVVGNLPCSIYAYVENSPDPEHLSKILRKIKPEIAIIDLLDMPQNDLVTLRQESRVVIALDDTLEVNRSAIDLAINSLIDAGQADFLGLDYLILPGPLEEKFVRNSRNKSIFINFGGYDHNNISTKIVEILLKLGESRIEFNVVVGNSDETFEKLQSIIYGDVNIRIHRQPHNFYSLLANSDVALVSGGLVMHTSLYLGVPTYVISQYEHQEKNAIKLSGQGALVHFGRAETVDLALAVEQLVNSLENNAGLSELAKKGKSLIRENGINRTSEILTVIGVLEWDSKFFGKRIARIFPTKLTQLILDYCLIKARDAQIDCLFFLCDSNDSTSILLAEKEAFHLVDVRVTFAREVPLTLEVIQGSTISCRVANLGDLEALILISGDFFQMSRYYFDGNFQKDKCKEFYQDWVTKSISGNFDDIVIVAEVRGELVGFISCKRSSRNLGRIGLVGVKKEQSGVGVGNILVNAALGWFLEQNVISVEVVTQGRNIAAQRLYQKSGFKTQKTELWYHKWMRAEREID